MSDADVSVKVEPLATKTIYAHGTIGIPLAVIGYPLAIWIPAHYANGLGISLAMVGTILMLARFTDVITDPLMGELSDRYRTRFGRRKPWVLLGVPVMMFGVYKLFIPPEGQVGIWYFLVYLTVFFLGSTMIALPHRAWGAELSPDYHQRSRVTAAREFFILGGLMLAATVPMVVEVTSDGAAVGEVFSILASDAVGAFSGDFRDRTVVDRATLTGPVLMGLAYTIILVLPICAFIVLTFVKEPPATGGQHVSLKDGFRQLWKNGPMRRVLIIVLMVIFGEAFRNAVSLFFIRDIVGVPTIGAAYFFYFVAGLGAIPFWLWLGRKIGKHLAFGGTLILVAMVSGANLFLSYGDYLPFFLLFIVKGFCFGGLQFLPFAMLADVVDVETARSGGKRAGSYFAILGLTDKLAVALGTGIALNVVGLLGFSASGDLSESTEIGIMSLRIVYCCGPMFFYSIALYFLWSYPLTPARHARLRERIARRQARLGQT